MATTTDENRELVHEYFDAWSDEDLDGLTALVAEDFELTFTTPTGDDLRLDVEGFRQAQAGYFENLSELTYEIHELVAEDDQVITRITWGGIHDGPLLGIEPTGTRIDVEEYLSFRIENGEIVDMHLLADNLDLLRQLGIELPIDE